jgi:hypothetical protein
MDIHVRVKLTSGEYEWRTVRAESISTGMDIAEEMPDVVDVLEGSVVPGGVVT